MGVPQTATVVYGQRSREAMEGHAMVLTGGIRVGMVTVAVMAASCGPATPSSTASPTAHATTAPRPSAAVGACASVTTTTPIAQVSAACAALWAPYGVTKVPPANLTDATPTPPGALVVNGTQGAVSDTEAQRWALAANRAAIWDRWAERYDQVALLNHIIAQSLVPASELSAMNQGAQVNQPDCSSFGTRYGVFPIGTTGATYFSGLGQHTSASYVLSVMYPGPCQIVASYPDGRKSVLFSFATAGTTVFAGSVHDDPVLGSLWFAEAAADCANQAAPQAWCLSNER